MRVKITIGIKNENEEDLDEDQDQDHRQGSGLRQGSPIDRCNSEIVSCVGEKSIEGAR